MQQAVHAKGLFARNDNFPTVKAAQIPCVETLVLPQLILPRWLM